MALINCNPKLLARIIGGAVPLYNLCKASIANIVGTLCLCLNVSYLDKYLISPRILPSLKVSSSSLTNKQTSPNPRLTPWPANG